MAKPMPGHKRSALGVAVECECGWRSATYWGKGAMSHAGDDFKAHKANALPAGLFEPPKLTRRQQAQQARLDAFAKSYSLEPKNAADLLTEQQTP